MLYYRLQCVSLLHASGVLLEFPVNLCDFRAHTYFSLALLFAL
jgi:hypothetical protein